MLVGRYPRGSGAWVAACTVVARLPLAPASGTRRGRLAAPRRRPPRCEPRAPLLPLSTRFFESPFESSTRPAHCTWGTAARTATASRPLIKGCRGDFARAGLCTHKKTNVSHLIDSMTDQSMLAFSPVYASILSIYASILSRLGTTCACTMSPSCVTTVSYGANALRVAEQTFRVTCKTASETRTSVSAGNPGAGDTRRDMLTGARSGEGGERARKYRQQQYI